MRKTVTLKLKSELCQEEVKVPADLWAKFEKRAWELRIAPEELFPIVLEHALHSPDIVDKVAKALEETGGEP